MAGHANNWYKPRGGALKGTSVYVSKAQRGGATHSEVLAGLEQDVKGWLDAANTALPKGVAQAAKSAPVITLSKADRLPDSVAAQLAHLPNRSEDPAVAAVQSKHKIDNITFNIPDKDRVAASEMLGYQFTDRVAAAMVGALDGSRVVVRVHPSGDVTIKVSSDDFLMYRRFMKENGKIIVSNDDFKAMSTGKGVGARVVGRQMEQLGALGIDRVELFAEGDKKNKDYNGYYTWPRLGYNAELTPYVKSKLPAPYNTVKDLHQLFAMPGGAEAWKEHGSSRDMSFNPSPNSMHRQYLQAYLDVKGIDPYSEPEKG